MKRHSNPSAPTSALPLVLLACLALLVAPSAQAAASASRSAGAQGARPRQGASAYPAGATRPAFTLTRSQLARIAAARRHRSKRRALPALRGNPARGLVAFQAMQRQYYIQGSGLYAGEPFSYLWPFSQALAATITLANVPALRATMARELKARQIGLQSYLDNDNSGAPEGTYTSALPAFDGTVAPPAGPGGPKYYDDNDWVGIELVRLFKLTRQQSLLGDAETIMAFEMAGWQTDPELACPGGIPFSNIVGNTDRNTVTTAPAAELAVQLYELTGNGAYLQFALTAYEWVRHCLQQPSGMYADHLSPTGVVEPTLWSYNQGTMIGAGTMLYQATRDSAYLYEARQTAKAALAYFTPERLYAEIPFFPSVYFRNLLYLDAVTHDPPGQRLAQGYVNYAWQNLRLSNDVFVGGSPSSAQLLVQAAIAQIYGLLSTPPSTYF
jgi:hypothetical protein